MTGVLLDMDGTLIDTEVIYFSSTMAAMTSLGYPDATEICHAMIGIPGPECEAMLLSRYGPQFSISGFNQEFVAHRDRLLEQGLPLKPGAIELLDALADAQFRGRSSPPLRARPRNGISPWPAFAPGSK